MYTVEYYSAIEMNEIRSFVEMWKGLESVWSEVSHKNKYHVLTHICGILGNGIDEAICRARIETIRCREQTCEYSGCGVGWVDLGDWDWYMHNAVCKTDS